MPEEGAIRISWSGEKSDDPETVGEILSAVGGLLREVTAEMVGDPDAIKWRMSPLRFICDGCGKDRPEDFSGWLKRDGFDYCPACQRVSSRSAVDA